MLMQQPFCNILVDPMPATVCVAGMDVPIYTDFRTGILFESLINDSTINDEEKAEHAFRLYFAEKELSAILEADAVAEATEALVWFYSCGKTKRELARAARTQQKTIQRRIYDFDVDAPLIYAAFLSQYHVDLQDVEELHWWKFSAMFSALHDTHEISKIMGYRAVDLQSIKNKAERNRLSILQAKYALPTNQSTEEKQRIAGAVFGGIR